MLNNTICRHGSNKVARGAGADMICIHSDTAWSALDNSIRHHVCPKPPPRARRGVRQAGQVRRQCYDPGTVVGAGGPGRTGRCVPLCRGIHVINVMCRGPEIPFQAHDGGHVHSVRRQSEVFHGQGGVAMLLCSWSDGGSLMP
jgi:hypothetical protein